MWHDVLMVVGVVVGIVVTRIDLCICSGGLVMDVVVIIVGID